MLKNIHFTLLALCAGFTSFSQEPITFVELGSNPSYCRLFDYQSGNGTVNASASGGVPDYEYQWTYLLTGETTVNSTWGGRNPGLYEIRVTDAMGTVAIDTVEVDSLNPFADLIATSPDIEPIDWGYTGDAPTTVSFTNTSLYFANPFDPFGDTVFFFKPIGPLDLEILFSYPELPGYTYEYGGVHTATLVAINKNGCADTTHKTIGLFGPLSIENSTETGEISVASHSIDQSIYVQKSSNYNELDFRVYDLSGKMILQEKLIDGLTILPMNGRKGTFVYELTDPKQNIQLVSGKLLFP